MARILLVDDDPEWQELLRKALPTYQVTVAGSYENALNCLEEAPYEVAIVDLNLLGSHSDELGKELLELLRRDYPTTRRIGLTGFPPSAVKKLLLLYDLDDLLLKAEAKLSEIRDVVKASVDRAYDDVSEDVRTARASLWNKAASRKQEYRQHLNRIEASQHQELDDAESAGRSSEDTRRALTALQATKKELLSRTKEFFSTLSQARTHEDLSRISTEFNRLTNDFGTG
jgi:response regulator RpfG family c-di-GMP phosphodiesterase